MDEWIRQAEVWVGQAESWIRQQPPEQIYVAAAVIALTILVFIAEWKSETCAYCDVPGHARLKPKLDEVLPKAAGLVFVVDAQDFLSTMQDAAEYLYDTLTKASVVKKKVPVLIFCNKTDKVTAHSKEFIKKQLEKEINKLRESRNAISSADISDEVKLGVPGEAFKFSQCQNKVTVAEGACLTGNVSAVEQFIREYVKA
nr:unnamed protein product [Digitaria exilis]